MTPQTIPTEVDLEFFNVITAYVLHALSKGQSTGILEVDPSKGKTVKSLLSASFPTIPATASPCRVVSAQTIGYFQALGLHALTYNVPKKHLAAKASTLNREFVEDSKSDGTTEEQFFGNLAKLL